MPLPWRPADPSPETRATAQLRLDALPRAARSGWLPGESFAEEPAWLPPPDPPAPPLPDPVEAPEPSPRPPVRGQPAAAGRAGLLDRLPAALRDVRLSPAPAGALALAAVAAVAVVVSVVLFLRARPHPVAVPRVVSPAAGAAATATVVVDVAGKVRRPGVVALPLGSRVGDAVRAAGGPLHAGDIGLLNLARKLVDGEQVLVGAAPAVGAAGAPSAGDAAAGDGLVDLNAATVAQLDALPGVGPVLAQRIVDYRTAHGPFTRVDQLRQIAGIGDRKYDDLQALVRV